MQRKCTLKNKEGSMKPSVCCSYNARFIIPCRFSVHTYTRKQVEIIKWAVAFIDLSNILFEAVCDFYQFTTT